mgnify:CR=1 FL=1
MKIQLHAVHFQIDGKLEEKILEKIEHLAHYNDKIERADVFLKLEKAGANIKEKIVEVKIHLPGADIFKSQNGHLFEEALDLAYDQIKGQIIKHKEKHS